MLQIKSQTKNLRSVRRKIVRGFRRWYVKQGLGNIKVHFIFKVLFLLT